MPRISVVIPIYNGERYLAPTIDSVRAQTTSDWELVLVDDGSVDRSFAMAERYSADDARIRVVRQANAGIAGARNRGFRETSPNTSYVIFLDHDDVWHPDALARLANALDAQPAMVAAHGAARFIDALGRPYRPGELESRARGRIALVRGCPVLQSSRQPTTFAMEVLRNWIEAAGQILIRRDALQAAGPFDSAMCPADDWDMWLRLSSRGDILFEDAVVLDHRRHANNTSNHSTSMGRAADRVRAKLLSCAELSAEQRQLIRFGHRWARQQSSRDWWVWARESVARRQWLTAANQARHAVVDRVQSYTVDTSIADQALYTRI